MKPRTILLILSALLAASILAILFRCWREAQDDAAFDVAAGRQYRHDSSYKRADTISLDDLP